MASNKLAFAEMFAATRSPSRKSGGASSKGSSLPLDPAVSRCLGDLVHALKSELQYHGGPQPSESRRNAGCITSGQRDGSAHILRCLKVWYDLPSDVFFTAMLSVDRFLAKMKVVSV